MDLRELEALKAEAAEAALTDPRVALEGYPRLAEQYKIHHFPDGLLAIYFNWLLAALKQQNRRDNQRLVGLLFEAFEARHAEGSLTSTALEIARRLRRLFEGSISGVDYQATSALLALLEEIDPSPPMLRRPDIEKAPSGEALAALEPEEAALLVLDGLRGGAGWIHQPEAFQEQRGFEARNAEAWADCGARLKEGDLTGVYLRAISLMQIAIDEAPAMAAAINLLLLRLEREGLPHTLRYEVALPQEQRLALSAELHGRIAQRFAPVAGFERFTRAQWRAAAAAARAWIVQMEGRAARQGGRPEDVAREASLSVWIAHALRAEGDLEGAQEVLIRSVSRARREAFDARALSALLLKESAEIEERLGDQAAALQLYGAAFKVALPGIKRQDRIERVVSILDGTSDDQCPRAQIVGIQVCAAMARLEHGELEWSRALLALNHERFHVDETARLSLLLELGQARILDPAASDRALEAALSLGDVAGIALARLYRALSACEGQLPLIEAACKSALKLSAGQIRRTVELVAVELYLEARQPERARLHLRRAVEALQDATPDGAHPLDLLAPEEDYSVEAFIQRLMGRGEQEFAYHLALALRRWRHRGASLPAGRLRDAIHAEVEAWIDDRLLEGDREGLAEAREAIKEQRYTWPTRLLKPGQARICYHLTERGGWIFAEDAQGLMVRPLEVTPARLEEEVDALLAAVARMDRGALYARGQSLWGKLLAPVEQIVREAELIMISPDGPLCRLPFALIGDRFFLASFTHVSVISAVDDSLHDPERPVAPPVAYVVGDHATLQELHIGAEEGPRFERVEPRLGEALSSATLDEALSGARLLRLVGPLGEEGHFGLSTTREAIPAARLAEACAVGGVATVAFEAPAPEARAAALWGLLPGLSAGAVVQRWPTGDGGAFAASLLSQLADVTDSRGLITTVGRVRKEAINRGISAQVWGAFEVYSAEWPRPR